MKNCILLAMLLPVLAGCATSMSSRDAGGWVNHVVSCGGPLLDMGHCLDRAGRICGNRGYQVLNREGGDLPAPNAMPGSLLPNVPTSIEDVKHYDTRKLLIRCN